MESAAIPSDKLYFKIGEVAKIVGVKPYVLRYWETEFSVIRPGKSPSKHRLYKRKDVETLLRIKELLHERRFTIEGARRHLRSGDSGEGAKKSARGSKSAAQPGAKAELDTLRQIRDELVDLRDRLAN